MTQTQQARPPGQGRPPAYVKTVHCFTDPNRRKHFEDVAEAAAYANELLRQGYQVKLYDFKSWTYADSLARRGPDG